MVDQVEAPVEQVEEEEPKKKGGKKKLVMILVLVLAGAGGYFFMFGGSGGEAEPEATEPVEGVVIDGATMTVATADAESHLARISFAVVLREGADSAVVGNKIQILQDAALTTISQYTAAELRSVEGLDRLRDDLTARALEVYPDGEVVRVVLTEVIVQ